MSSVPSALFSLSLGVLYQDNQLNGTNSRTVVVLMCDDALKAHCPAESLPEAPPSHTLSLSVAGNLGRCVGSDPLINKECVRVLYSC